MQNKIRIAPNSLTVVHILLTNKCHLQKLNSKQYNVRERDSLHIIIRKIANDLPNRQKGIMYAKGFKHITSCTLAVISFKAEIIMSKISSLNNVLRIKILGPVTGVKGTQHCSFG